VLAHLPFLELYITFQSLNLRYQEYWE
jgi:hypothetical protein